MNLVSEDIKDVLVAAGVGTFAAATGWSIHLNHEPNSPDDVVTVFDTTTVTHPFLNKRTPEEEAMVQVRVRATTYASAQDKLHQVLNTLVNKTSWTVTGDDSSGEGDVVYQAVYRKTGPIVLPRDEQNRAIMVLNFAVLRRRA